MGLKATIEGDELVIRLPVNTSNPPLSASRKSYSVASTNGNQSTEIMVKGKPVQIGVNAYISAK